MLPANHLLMSNVKRVLALILEEIAINEGNKMVRAQKLEE